MIRYVILILFFNVATAGIFNKIQLRRNLNDLDISNAYQKIANSSRHLLREESPSQTIDNSYAFLYLLIEELEKLTDQCKISNDGIRSRCLRDLLKVSARVAYKKRAIDQFTYMFIRNEIPRLTLIDKKLNFISPKNQRKIKKNRELDLEEKDRKKKNLPSLAEYHKKKNYFQEVRLKKNAIGELNEQVVAL